jgi:hypothetical protein
MDNKIVKILEESFTVYQCSILLPVSVASHIRCITGPCSYSKTDAKGIAAMICIKNLREEGEFNEWFQPSGSGGLYSKKQLRIQKAEFNGDNIDQSGDIPSNFRRRMTSEIVHNTIEIDKSKYDSNDKLEKKKRKIHSNKPSGNSFQEISVKSTPEFLKPPSLDMNIEDKETNNETTLLHLYAIRAVCINDLSFQSITHCADCIEHLKGINHLGLGFLTKLPSEILDQPFNFSLHDRNGMIVKLQFLQSRQVTNDEMLQMQRFHQAICCWEGENFTNPTSKEGLYLLIFLHIFLY